MEANVRNFGKLGEYVQAHLAHKKDLQQNWDELANAKYSLWIDIGYQIAGLREQASRKNQSVSFNIREEYSAPSEAFRNEMSIQQWMSQKNIFYPGIPYLVIESERCSNKCQVAMVYPGGESRRLNRMAI